MDRLDPPDKRALQAASAFGQRFPLAGLRHLLDAPGYECTRFIEHQLVRPEGEDYLFAHALIRDGIYESILTAARSRLHLKAAEWFADSDPALRAEHLHLAADPRAPRAYLDAARSELAKYRYTQAITLLLKGGALAVDGADRVALALELGAAQHDMGALPEAHAAFAEALNVADDDAARCRALLGLAGVKRITEDLDGALVDLAGAEAAARSLGLTVEEAKARFLRGNVLFPKGDIDGCLREHDAALTLARDAGSAELEAAALGGLADAEYMRGRLRTACARFTECVKVSRVHGFGRIEVANLPMVAFTALWSGDFQRAFDLAFESIDAARRIGHSRAEMIAHHVAFMCRRARGEIDLARQHVSEAAALSRRLGARRFEAEALLFRAELDYFAGDRRTALAAARDADAICRETGLAYIGPMTLGGLALITDDDAERRACSVEAESLLAAGSISHNHVSFRCNAIEACLNAGENDEAARHAQALRDYCPEDGLGLVIFFAERGLALARADRGERSPELATEIGRLIAEAVRMQQKLSLGRLHRAREALGGYSAASI
jgi:tetratricopeptide (TPR) repeat protein